jgi:sirohydrochlorin ferrochelatase
VTALLLVSHGSRDAAAQETTERVAAAVAAELVDVQVAVGYLELASPTVSEALDRLAHAVVVQPLLFVPAYHATTDLPRQLASRSGLTMARVLAPDPLLCDAVDRRLAEALDDGPAPDGLVLASAGTSSPTGRVLLERVADEWGHRHLLPCRVGFASMTPSAGDAVRALHDAGCRRVAVGSLFIAPGRLPAAASDSARRAGATAVAPPLGPCPELVSLLVGRFHEASPARDRASGSRGTSPAAVVKHRNRWGT